jgi:hypothetical protein
MMVGEPATTRERTMANKDKRSSNVKKKAQKNLKQKREARKVKKATTSTGSGWEGGAA